MSKRINKLSGEAKRDLLWTSIRNDQANDLRSALTATGVEAHTRHEETERTLIMEAAYAGKKKTLDVLLDWYSRRRELRLKGWIDLLTVDEYARTPLMLAASGGHVECVESLLRAGANPILKDASGKTALDIAKERNKKQVVEAIMEFFNEGNDNDEGEDGAAAGGGGGDDDPSLQHLTTSQRRKLKKQNLLANERGATATATTTTTATADVTTTTTTNPTTSSEKKSSDERIKFPAPVWAEVIKLCESFDQLRPLHELSVDLPTVSSFDPALWNCHWLHKLTAKMGSLVSIPGPELVKLSDLQQIVLSNSTKLTSLPEEIGSLKRLRVLECDGCSSLTTLPLSLSQLTNLTTLNVNNCKIKSLSPALDGCSALTILSVSGNELTEVSLNFPNMTRLNVLKISRNKLKNLPDEIGLLVNLSELEAENNSIKMIPFDLYKLKKLKVLRLANNPITDGKITTYLQQEGRGLKDLLKYLESSAMKKGKNNSSKKQPQKQQQQEEEESDHDDNVVQGVNTTGTAVKSEGGEIQEESSDLDIDEDDI
jgi:Leucine-rich repeat (LRR) protein